jgi:hypothetical protein
MVYVVTGRAGVLDAVKAALKTDAVVHCRNANETIAAVVPRKPSKSECAIIDLASVPDAERIITFIQSSPSVANLRIVALCSDEQYDALPEHVAISLNGVILTPYSAMDIASVVASICGPYDSGADIERQGSAP